MFKHLIPLLVTLSVVTAYQNRPPYPQYTFDTFPSAASRSQIKFAEENKYDDTGPGAKKPEGVYNTYNTLEDALVAYLDDPDTKLPEHERAKAIDRLLGSQPYHRGFSGYYPKSYNYAPEKFQQPQQDIHQQAPVSGFETKTYYPASSQFSFAPIHQQNPFQAQYDQKSEPFKFQKIQAVKNSPLSLAHYTRDPEVKSPFEEYNPFPQYSYSFGVHDKATGDIRQAADSRPEGNVRGFYTFIDDTGKQHIVHYTADEAIGFRT